MTSARATSALIGLRADSFVHVGIGQAFGEVDLPFVREPATDYPHIPGSAFKGALRRAWWEAHPEWKTEKAEDGSTQKVVAAGPDERLIFGHTDTAAGLLLVGDLRLVFLPVRALGQSFRYLTCPTLLRRVARDLGRAGGAPAILPDFEQSGPADPEQAVADEGTGQLFLEEYPFTIAKGFDAATDSFLVDLLGCLVTADKGELAGMRRRIVLVRDDDFATFARHGLPVRMRNALDENKLVKPGALWSEEYLPPESLLHAVLADRSNGRDQPDPLAEIRQLLAGRGHYLQIGGNETVGQGLCQLRMGP